MGLLESKARKIISQMTGKTTTARMKVRQGLYHQPCCRPRRTCPPSRKEAGERRTNHPCASTMYTSGYRKPYHIHTSAVNSIASPIAKKRASPAPYGDSGPSLPSFEPVVRILKRSTNATGATAAPTTTSSQKSLVERERDYQQARERIFGSTSEGAISSSDNIPKDSEAPSIVKRQPRGPSSEDAVGFRRQPDQM